MNPMDCLLVHPAVDGLMVDGLGPCRLVGHCDILVFREDGIVGSTIFIAVINAAILVIKNSSVKGHILDTDLLLLDMGDGGVVDLLVPCGGHDAPDLLELGRLGAAGI